MASSSSDVPSSSVADSTCLDDALELKEAKKAFEEELEPEMHSDVFVGGVYSKSIGKSATCQPGSLGRRRKMDDRLPLGPSNLKGLLDWPTRMRKQMQGYDEKYATNLLGRSES